MDYIFHIKSNAQQTPVTPMLVSTLTNCKILGRKREKKKTSKFEPEGKSLANE